MSTTRISDMLAPCDRFAIVPHAYECADGSIRFTLAARCFTPEGENPVGFIDARENVLRRIVRSYGLVEDAALGESGVSA